MRKSAPEHLVLALLFQIDTAAHRVLHRLAISPVALSYVLCPLAAARHRSPKQIVEMA